uniref:Uncharacterized protein n=1 Tax=Hucho hucho TaxID=62062 RepID=A0A4W5NMU2_9TELE
MQYSLPSPLGAEPYWQEVSSLECAPIATTEEDTLMEMSDVQVWPSGVSPSLVTVEDSSLDGSSRADDSEGATLSLPCSLGRPSSGASGSIMELEEEEEEEEEGEVEEEEEARQELADRVRASGAVPKVNLNGQLGGQRSEGRRVEVAASVAGSSVTGGGARGGGGGGLRQSSEEGLSVVAGQQVYAQLCEMSGLSRAMEHNGDNRVVGGGAFQPYLPNKDSLRGWAGSQAPRLPRQSVETLMMSPRSRVTQEALLTPIDADKEDCAVEFLAEEQLVDEHGSVVTRKVGVDVRKGAQSVKRNSLRRVKH